MKSKPNSLSLTFDLSLPSDEAAIDWSLHLKADILESPRVISLSTSTAEAAAS